VSWGGKAVEGKRGEQTRRPSVRLPTGFPDLTLCCCDGLSPYMTALALTVAATGNTTLKARLDSYVEELAGRTRANPGG
jgi:hypothetical protein